MIDDKLEQLRATIATTRDPEQIRRQLGDWFTHTLGAAAQPKLSSLQSPGKAGNSSETLLFDMSWQEKGAARSGKFVLRLPPTSGAFPIFEEYDFDLQVGVMRLVGAGSKVPVPNVPWQECRPEPLGAPFFIMERIAGEMVPDNPPYIFGGWLCEASAAEQSRMQQQLLEVLAGVHGVKASAAETAFLQIDKPGDTPLRRHFAWQKDFYAWGRNGLRFPLAEQLFDWLEQHWPAHDGEAVVCWGDARPANILWQDFKAMAVLDWEEATMAPREMDVGYMIFFHQYFRDVARKWTGADPMSDFLRRDEVVTAYEKLTGTKLQDIDWYISYGLLRQSLVEIRISQRRILFGEMEQPADNNDYLYGRPLIERILAGQADVWAH